MKSIEGFDFFSLNFDEKGVLQGAEFNELGQRAAAATDAIFLAHGFRNSADDATSLYTKFLQTFRGHLARPEFQEVAGRKFVVAGLFWPSLQLPESFKSQDGGVQAADGDAPLSASLVQKLQDLKTVSPEHAVQLDAAIALLPHVEDDAAAQDQFSDLLLALTDGGELDATEGLQQIRQQPGSVLLQKLSLPVILPTQAADAGFDRGGVASLDDFTAGSANGSTQGIGSFFGSILGGVDKFINLTTWYIMKNRSGVVGANGVAKAVRDLKASNAAMRIHLVGHSLGGRLMAACAKSLAQSPLLQPDSVTLLEAAFSHYGFSPNNGKGTAGFFRDVIDKKVVKGPLLETFSFQDTAVGANYAIASRLAGDNVKAIGDASDEFGGIGRNGAQLTSESVFLKLKTAAAPGGPYAFQTGVVTCLDGSGGLIKDHGDVTNENVTYAFASSVAATAPLGKTQSGSAGS
ncbi:MAG TPA: hypothetical protein VK604_03180 [Bryobacteraceae bacterium]|nr:hypothetical protein [Bryobacteraceae bacterium]